MNTGGENSIVENVAEVKYVNITNVKPIAKNVEDLKYANMEERSHRVLSAKAVKCVSMGD